MHTLLTIDSLSLGSQVNKGYVCAGARFRRMATHWPYSVSCLDKGGHIVIPHWYLREALSLHVQSRMRCVFAACNTLLIQVQEDYLPRGTCQGYAESMSLGVSVRNAVRVSKIDTFHDCLVGSGNKGQGQWQVAISSKCPSD